MNATENLNSINKYKFNMRILIGIIAILLIVATLYMVFADSSVVPIITEENGVPYMYFELEHNLSNAQYKYYGYGYTVSVYEPGPNGALLATEYLHNAQFSPYMDGSTEKVWIPMQEIYDMVNLDDEFYSVRNMKVYLNGRLGIKVNGTLTYLYDSHEGNPENGLKETGLQTGYWKEDGLTVPLNKDGQGIANGIKHEYGVSWTPITYTNLRQHFGIPLTVPAIYKYDRYRVEYREVSSKKTVSSEKPYKNFEDTATITEYPVMVNGYEYAGQYMIKKIDTDNNEVNTDPYGDIQEGDSATINIKKNADRYIITFYYTKIDPSTIGNPVTVNIEYKEDDYNGKKLLDSTTTIGGDLSQFNFNSAKIDEYTCKGYYVIGQATEYFYNTNASFIIGKEDYAKPVDGKLRIVFIYEKTPYVSIPKCSPYVYGDADTVNISMKKKDFENATEISVNNAVFRIENFTAGKDANGDSVEGTHEFNYFDLYIDKYKSSYDNKSKEISQSFIVPKNIFTQSATDTNLYTTYIDVTYAAFCKCFDGKPDSDGDRGWAIDNGSLKVNINLIVNKPPVALYTYYTSKKLEDGRIDKLANIYVGKETVIENRATDPNGNTDIKKVKYTLKDSNSNQYYVNLLMLGNGTYFLDEDNVNGKNIVFQGITDYGDLKLKFLTSEAWTITQYVEDLEGLNDTYEGIIKPEVLNLNPIAVLKDSIEYRYPLGVEFNGKQNRVIQLNSKDSYVCDYLRGTGVTINQNRDCWEIIPLDGQSFDSIKFEYDINSQIVDGVLQVKYTPLNNIKMMFKEKGRYKFMLQVSDSEGNVSNWTEQVLTINEDLPPIVTADVNSKYYRNSSKNATIRFNARATSTDDDLTEITNIGYKFDSNNNGSYTDEILQTANLSHKDVNINGILYKEITLTSSKVGKYQFIINVKEDFKQETLENYINEQDYKTGSTYVVTEIDNTAPIGTLGLEKYNNIDVKVLTTGLTGTRQVDVENNLNNLKLWLESEKNIKVGDIELLNLANEKNGLTNEDSLTWRKVAMNGYADDYKFRYAEIEGVTDTGDPETDPEKPLVGFWYNMLPNGVYADGWSGIPVPDLYLGDNLGGVEIESLKYKDINKTWGNNYPIRIVERNYYDLNYSNNNVNISIHNSTIWGTPYSDVTFYSAISDKRLKDFDIEFDLNVYPVTYGEDSMGDAVFLFNVQDKNNYFAYSEKYERNWEAGNKIAEIVQIKNGVSKILEEFYYTRKKSHGEWEYYDTTVSRIKQVGNLLQAYDGNTLVFETNINSIDAGGYLGISAKDGYTSSSVYLDINSLAYIENSSIENALDQLNWNGNSDKYIINLVEGNKLTELADNEQLNKTAGILQGKEINLINIGVNSVNGNKLKELISKNQNNGTYIELNNVYNNLNTAASYIRNKYSGSSTVDQYLLLGNTINYKENYSDNENDPLFSKAFKFYHLPTYFENNLGTINNNNVWVQEPIETFNKTGKYTLSYQVRDNPLYPDMNMYNSFNSYRKYSSLFTQDIYVHRKPIASFSISDFTANAYNHSSFFEDFEDENYLLEPVFTRYEGNDAYLPGKVRNGYLYLKGANRYDNDFTYKYGEVKINVPSFALNAKVNFSITNENGCGSIIVYVIGSSISNTYYANEDVSYEIPSGNLSLLFIIPKYNGTLDRPEFHINDMELSYDIPNENASITITENSYDLDHKSRSDKGINEWEWKIVDKNGVTTTYNTTNRTSSINWIKNTLKLGAKWFNSTVLLRVKDLEGTWSDWDNRYIKAGDEGLSSGQKPIAKFLIDKNPLILNTEKQTITDTSYDLNGLALTNAWTVKKEGIKLFTSIEKNISDELNNYISENGYGKYEISLIVKNTKEIYSDEVTKSFDVTVFNQAPTTDFNLVSNENPIWTFPKTLGLYTLRYRPTNTLFHEEYARFDTNVNDPNTDNTGFIYNWRLERFAVKDINNISGAATNTYNYTTQFPFANSFKNQGLSWGAYRITLKVTDKPPIPPYASTDAKSAQITKSYYIVPEISLVGSLESDKSEIMIGDSIKLKAKTSKMANTVGCNLNGTGYALSKVSEDSNYAYWEKNITIPDSITESGTYQLQFVGKTTYGGNGNITREVKDNVPIDIVALKLINFRITNIVNHPYITFPYTKDMLLSALIPYKTGYYVTFQIDSKGKPDNVYGRIDIGNNGPIDQNISMTKVITGDTETWQGRFYSSAHLPVNTIICIKLDCSKGSVTYNYNEKESWDGRSLITEGSALQDGRVNLTN
nr:hypothetical protein [Sedimentibacter sp.]